jgi:uncharacterized protein YbcI
MSITQSSRTQDVNQQIGNYIGKLLRDTFGKGPETVYVSTGRTFFTAYLRNFMSPMERMFMENDQWETVLSMRQKLMQTLWPDIRANVELLTGVRIHEFYADWGLHNRSGMLVGVSSEEFPCGTAFTEEFEGKEEIESELVKISQHAEKVPEEMYSCALNARTIVVVRNGILVRIEKELVRLGHSQLLRTVKANLEKSYLHNNDYLEAFLQRHIVDSFVDWDFNLDKSIIIFVLHPKPMPDVKDRTLVD